jgi:hypothetical protein
MKQTLIALIIKLLAFYYRLLNYIWVMHGRSVVSPADVSITTSLVYKFEVAPPGKVFYIARCKLGRTTYSKNVALRRTGLPVIVEANLKYKLQRVFAASLTKKLN